MFVNNCCFFFQTLALQIVLSIRHFRNATEEEREAVIEHRNQLKYYLINFFIELRDLMTTHQLTPAEVKQLGETSVDTLLETQIAAVKEVDTAQDAAGEEDAKPNPLAS